MAKRISIYLGDEAQAYVEGHTTEDGSTSGAIYAAIDRLGYLLKTAMPTLTDDEWQLIYDARNGAINTPASQAVSGLIGAIEDAIDLDHLDKKYDIDGVALLAKLKKLDRVGRMAVLDSAEQYWAKQN